MTINRVTLVGNLGRDPEVRFFPDGGKVAAFSVATKEIWRDRGTQERKEHTEWHHVICHIPQLVEIIEKSCTKGNAVYVEGKLRTRKWQDNDGKDRYTTEIIANVVRNFGKRESSHEDAVEELSAD